MWSDHSDAQDGEVRVTVGIDRHIEQHVGVALDQFGRRLGTSSVPTTPAGFAELVAWARTFGTLERLGVEGTGSYGAGLTRWLRAHGLAVVEVEHPRRHDRQARRRRGKSDPLDAEAAARAVQAGTVAGQPKAGDGQVEMIRTLRLARRSAMKARTQAANQLHALVVTAPDELRARLRALPMAELVRIAAAFRPVRTATALTTPLAATKLALQGLAIRYRQLSAEIDALDGHLERLVSTAAPDLLAIKGVGTDIAGALLVAAGDNPGRLHSEAAFASLCGVAPIPASSGKTNRHRLSRGGDRDANRALYLLALGRMGWDPPTRTYVTRRTAAGLSKPEIIRCLKRYLAREIYRILVPTPAALLRPAAKGSPTQLAAQAS
jgi:transposase